MLPLLPGPSARACPRASSRLGRPVSFGVMLMSQGKYIFHWG